MSEGPGYFVENLKHQANCTPRPSAFGYSCLTWAGFSGALFICQASDNPKAHSCRPVNWESESNLSSLEDPTSQPTLLLDLPQHLSLCPGCHCVHLLGWLSDVLSADRTEKLVRKQNDWFHRCGSHN